MDTIDLNGTTYTKATKLARDFGYTADYVGQLCRADKVDAQLVGRTWFVSADSLRSHRNEKKRSSAGYEKRAIAAGSKKGTDTESQLATRSSTHISYDRDNAELLPEVKKSRPAETSTDIDVSLVGSEEIDVTSAPAYRVDFAKDDPPPLKGELAVEDLDVDTDTPDQVPLDQSQPPKNAAPKSNSAGSIVAMRRRQPGPANQNETHPENHSPHRGSASTRARRGSPQSSLLVVLFPASVGLALVAVVALLGLESSVLTREGGAVTTSLSFAATNVWSAINLVF